MKLIKENIGLAKVTKEDQGVVDPTYASAIRDFERSDKLKQKTLKTLDEPEHDEDPKNPKMVSGAKKLHLDESLFENYLVETGEWEDDDEGLAWKQQLLDLIHQYTPFDNVELEDVEGYDKYQGPYVYDSGLEFWIDNEAENCLLIHNLNYNLMSDSNWYRICSREDFDKFERGNLEPLSENLKEDVSHTYDGNLKEGDTYYTITVFEEKGKNGYTLEPSSPEDAFDELYFTNPNEAQEYADKHYPNAYSIMIRENDWNDGERTFWTSGPYLKRENGKWSKYSSKLSEARLGKTKEVKVLQGNYGYGWEDLIEYDIADFNGDLLAMNREIKQDLKDYRENETDAPHRVITRRVARELEEDRELDKEVSAIRRDMTKVGMPPKKSREEHKKFLSKLKDKRKEIKESAEPDVAGFVQEIKQVLKPEDIDTYESDLYVRVSPEARRLLRKYNMLNNPLLSTFVDEIDHDRWYDIPFGNLGNQLSLTEECGKLNEGAGAGYIVRGELYDIKINHIEDTEIYSGKSAFGTDLEFAKVKVDADARFDGTVESYYYGAELENSQVKITELDINPNILYYLGLEEFNYGEITAEDLESQFGSTLKFESDVIGGGWVHTSFDGNVKASRVNDDNSPFVDGVKFHFVNQEDIDYAEQGLQGELDDDYSEDDYTDDTEDKFNESVNRELVDEFAYEYGLSKAEARKRLKNLSKEEQQKKLKLLKQGRNKNAKADFYESINDTFYGRQDVRDISVEPGYHEWVLKVDGQNYYSFGDVSETIDSYERAEDFADSELDCFDEASSNYFDRNEEDNRFFDNAKEIGKLDDSDYEEIYQGLIDAYVYYVGNNGVNESVLQDLQADHEHIRKVYGQEVYDALDEYVAAGNDLGKTMYSEKEWNRFVRWAKQNKGLTIKKPNNDFIKDLEEGRKPSSPYSHFKNYQKGFNDRTLRGRFNPNFDDNAKRLGKIENDAYNAEVNDVKALAGDDSAKLSKIAKDRWEKHYKDYTDHVDKYGYDEDEYSRFSGKSLADQHLGWSAKDYDRAHGRYNKTYPEGQ